MQTLHLCLLNAVRDRRCGQRNNQRHSHRRCRLTWQALKPVRLRIRQFSPCQACNGRWLHFERQSVCYSSNKRSLAILCRIVKQHSQQHFHSFDIASAEKHWVTFMYLHNDSHSNFLLYRTLQPEYQYARYLSEVKCFSNRRLLSRCRSGCHELRVHTGRWEDSVHRDRKDRLFLVCRSSQQASFFV